MLLYEMIDYIARELTGTGIAPEESYAMARILLAHKLAIDLPYLPLHHHTMIDLIDISEELARLKAGEPLQYVIGETDFMGLPMCCAPSALIPRGDSEAVAEKAMTLMQKLPMPLIADICTGSGAYALALAAHLPQARIWAVDISPEALILAIKNATRLQLLDRIEFIEGDLLNPLIEKNLRFDLIISNPPYIPSAELENLPPQVKHEPAIALDGGADGLYFYRRLAADAASLLKPDGLLLMEHGADQTGQVAKIMQSAGFTPLEVIEDYGHHQRGTLVKRS
jgi:release factor glutamine methyltransferase